MTSVGNMLHFLICFISVVGSSPLRKAPLDAMVKAKGERKDIKIRDFSNLIEMANKKEVEEKNDLTENDMKLLKLKPRRRRLATLVESWKWSKTIPFVFDNVLPVDEILKNLTLQAFEHIAKYTCINFIPRTNEEDYINVTSLSGCWSYVGKKGGMQELSLDSVGCDDFNVVVHEVLHALGFFHEHNRPDRDEYIVVNFTNVKPGFESNLFKRTLEDPINGDATLQNISYDKKSVMHYGRYTFSKHLDEYGYIYPGKENMTMYVIGNSEEQLGSENGLSYKDQIRVNRLYNCNVTVTMETFNTTSSTASPTTSHVTSSITTYSTTTDESTSRSQSDSPSTRQSTSITTEQTLSATTSANGSNWGKPDNGVRQSSSYQITLSFLFITIAFMNFS